MMRWPWRKSEFYRCSRQRHRLDGNKKEQRGGKRKIVNYMIAVSLILTKRIFGACEVNKERSCFVSDHNNFGQMPFTEPTWHFSLTMNQIVDHRHGWSLVAVVAGYKNFVLPYNNKLYIYIFYSVGRIQRTCRSTLPLTLVFFFWRFMIACQKIWYQVPPRSGLVI